MKNPALILIDVQNDFFTGPLKTKRAHNIIPPLQKLLVAARKNKIPVIYAIDAHYPQDVEVTQKWGNHALKGTEGAKIIPELKPDQNKDYIVEKRTYSSFYETGLDPLLRSLYKGDGVKTVILGGLHTNICIRHTSADAFFRGYKIIVAEDSVEAFTKKDHIEGIKYLEYVYGAKAMKTEEIIREIVK